MSKLKTFQSIYDIRNQPCWFYTTRYYAMNFDFFEMEPHTHNELEIMYVASGSCKIIYWQNVSTQSMQLFEWQPLDGHVQKEYLQKLHNEASYLQTEYTRCELTLKEGEYLFVDCNTKHQLEVARGTLCRILNLEISLLSEGTGISFQSYFEQSKSFQNFLSLPASVTKGYDDTGTLHTIITELHKQLQNEADVQEHRVMQNLLMAQFLIEIGRQSRKKHHADSGSRYVRKAISYLSNHFDQDVKINEVAEEIGISTAYLQRLFKEQTTVTLIDKMNEFRIEKAKLLLETSLLPVMDIAISVGFNNRQHFTYTFFKYTGCSPAVYRKHKGDYLVWKGFGSDRPD